MCMQRRKGNARITENIVRKSEEIIMISQIILIYLKAIIYKMIFDLKYMLFGNVPVKYISKEAISSLIDETRKKSILRHIM